MLNSFLYPKMAFKKAKCNIQFMCTVLEKEIDPATGKMTGEEKPQNIMFSVKCNASDVDATMTKLTGAVPN
eukprot:CAMPEP_0119504116 /NCGR_PEP_ID=MMETSP1344-20130328/25071_1 /TAXON_ID=236787 /ORGANISM="Florenciella parvula, Strain CCMP2471" /LENGTH=70 /DNA_ID=CAMNT_0007540457 /DNA_START=42 /DNA_END=254 /DNA_ORIENTATION=+